MLPGPALYRVSQRADGTASWKLLLVVTGHGKGFKKLKAWNSFTVAEIAAKARAASALAQKIRDCKEGTFDKPAV